MIDIECFVRLATAAIQCAIFDCMNWSGRCTHKERSLACAWLGSRQAAIFFDICGINQEVLLIKIGWPEAAQRILDQANDSNSTPNQRVVIRLTLRYLEKIA